MIAKTLSTQATEWFFSGTDIFQADQQFPGELLKTKGNRSC